MATKKRQDETTRREAIAKVASRIEGFRPAKEVLTKVKSVKTIFPQLNVASRVGGWPIERLGLIHGNFGEGKTELALGLGKSFLIQDHFFGLVDAEYTTPDEWVSSLLGDYANHPGFLALRPTSYEQTIESVRSFAKSIAKAKEDGELSDTSGLIVVDSLAKLVPENLVEKLRAESVKDGADGAKGRGGMLQAAMNSQWLKELTPLLYHTGTALVIISRESENPNAGPWDPKFKVQGGKAPPFESSFTCRVFRDSYVKVGEKVVGERHGVRVMKTKVGGKDGKYTDFYYHTTIEPSTFDIERDVMDMALEAKIIKRSGRIYSYEDETIASSHEDAINWLKSDKARYDIIQRECEQTWKPVEIEAA